MIRQNIELGLQRIANHFGYRVTRINRTDSILYKSFPADSLQQRRFYNIGAGTFSHPYWTNIDFASPWYSKGQYHRFIEYNLMELAPLAIEDNTAELVYSSHTIEHVSDDAVRNMLREAHRILKPGGYIRLTTPDMALAYDAYKRGDRQAIHGILKEPFSPHISIHQIFLRRFATQLTQIGEDTRGGKKCSDAEIMQVFSEYPMEQALDYFSQQCEYDPNYAQYHMNWWTEAKLINFLKDAGFADCYRSGYGQSKSPPFRNSTFFDNTHPGISLYTEATK